MGNRSSERLQSISDHTVHRLIVRYDKSDRIGHSAAIVAKDEISGTFL